MKIITICFLSLFVFVINVTAQYSTSSQLSERIKALSKLNEIVYSESLATTSGGKDISVITLGTGNRDDKPGIAILGGINGASLASTEIVMQMAEKLTSLNPRLLDEVTFYFIPNVSPDATDQYFEPLKYERQRNAVPFDDDRDGLTDEDGYDDLNNDGLITLMRILDSEKGEYMIHPDNSSVMVKADVAKNQKGDYLVMLEGMDNDKDDKINEDIPGGTTFNKNFSFNYPYFSEGAGYNALSDIESRAVAEFLFESWNIFAVLCIGPENNLSEYSDLKAELPDKNIKAVVDENDKPYFERIVGLYKKNVRLPDSTKVSPSGGDLLSWVYFHYNRYGFSTPAWNFSKNKNNLEAREFDYLKWASENELNDQTVPWSKIEHPDFPGKTVEVGGIKPFLMLNPPFAYIDTIVGDHLKFLVNLAEMHPSVKFNDIKITKQADNLFLVEAEIINSGKLPTMPVLAQRSKWVKKVRLDIVPAQKQTIVGGKKVYLYDRIVPGQTLKSSWLIKNSGTIQLKVGSPQTGYIIKEVKLN